MSLAKWRNLSIPQRAHIRREALAFRIWQVCQPIGWNITIHEAADRLGVRANAVLGAARVKGWLNRFRTQRLDTSGIAMRNGACTVHAVDSMFDGADDTVLLGEVA